MAMKQDGGGKLPKQIGPKLYKGPIPKEIGAYRIQAIPNTGGYKNRNKKKA